MLAAKSHEKGNSLKQFICTYGLKDLLLVYLVFPTISNLAPPHIQGPIPIFTEVISISPDYWIHWELLGTPPKGSLLKNKSKTDSQGQAENFYFGPADSLGEETIKVGVIV